MKSSLILHTVIFQAKVRMDGFMQGLTSTIHEVPRNLCRGFLLQKSVPSPRVETRGMLFY